MKRFASAEIARFGRSRRQNGRVDGHLIVVKPRMRGPQLRRYQLVLLHHDISRNLVAEVLQHDGDVHWFWPWFSCLGRFTVNAEELRELFAQCGNVLAEPFGQSCQFLFVSSNGQPGDIGKCFLFFLCLAYGLSPLIVSLFLLDTLSTFSGNAFPLLILAVLLFGIFSGLALLVGATLQLLCRFLAVVDCRLYVLLKLLGLNAEPFGAAVAHLVLPINPAFDIDPVVVHPTKRSNSSPRGYKASQFVDVLARFLPADPHIRTRLDATQRKKTATQRRAKKRST